ncbi:MAG: D-alanyl-D-alanine carboxypeptidase family protein [Ruminococcaceae bacterium]|nr:D-alanyl-D-alanine carboxypeptidase family protein [Oscillospiraceae bacterium]
MSFLENIDKNKLQKILLVVISALVLAALVCLVVIIISSLSPASAPVNTDFELTDLTLTDKNVNTGSLLLVDGNHPYSPQEEWLELVNCGDYMRAQSDYTAENDKDFEAMNYIPWKAMSLSKLAMPSVHAMLSAAKNEVGEKPITIDGAYDTIKHGEVSPEYKTALMIYLSDFDSTGTTRVALSEAYRSWLDKNAAKYGFIESFEDAYRYVGVAHATYMTEEGLSLSEYIEYLKQNTNSSKALKIKLNDQTYLVYYEQGSEGDTVKVPAKESYTLSGTNEGGVIVTVTPTK